MYFLYAKNFVRRLSISAQFTFIMYVAARNRDKFTKNPYFVGSKSFKVDDFDIPKKLVNSACYDNRHDCAYLQLFSCYTNQYKQNKRANCVKITSFEEGDPL